MRRAAAGWTIRLPGKEPENGGIELAVKTDAMGVRATSARTGGFGATVDEVTRLRPGLEGFRSFVFEGGASLTPSVDGAAETGFEIGYRRRHRLIGPAVRSLGRVARAQAGFPAPRPQSRDILSLCGPRSGGMYSPPRSTTQGLVPVIASTTVPIASKPTVAALS